MTKNAKLRHSEYYDFQDCFDELYTKSKQDDVFTNLIEIISSEENIRLAYRNIKHNSGSQTSGVDKLNIKDIEKLSAEELVEIIQRKFRNYKPKPVKRVEIPKPNGKTRPLEHALAQCYKMIQRQDLHFVVDVDIKGFFDKVNHSKLIRQMWTLGIRDKQLICIIKAMLKAPIVLPNGDVQYPTKGTAQGGVISPLLANIVLNECRKRSDADKVFIAVKQWLKDRLSLEISEEKSKVVNLKRHYSEFLGFKLKAVRKGGKFVVRSHMSDKAVKCETEKLKEQVRAIEHHKNTENEIKQIYQYNSIVFGIHNYYRYATDISLDCAAIQFQINTVLYNRLKGQLEKQGSVTRKYIAKHYGKSKMLRYINGEPLCPIGYVKTKNPMYKKKKICKYTAEGREEIHRNLKFDETIISVLHMLARAYLPNRSVEYMDNRVSLYAAQYGKCAVTGKVLWIDEIHCHHKKPISQGGTDEYKNLIIVHIDVHKLIHATKSETIQAYLNKIKPKSAKLKHKINCIVV